MRKPPSIARNIIGTLSRTEDWAPDFKQVLRVTVREMGGAGFALYRNGVLDGSEGLPPETAVLNINAPPVPPMRDIVSLAFRVRDNDYIALVHFRQKALSLKNQIPEIQDLLNALGKSFSAQQVAKERILETQIINELNLNITTIMDERKIIRQVETAARRMTGIDRIFLFSIRDDRLIAVDRQWELKRLPRQTVNALFSNRHLTKVKSRQVRPLIPGSTPGTTDYLFIPCTIKNQLHAFFLYPDDPDLGNRTYALTRLKFLANQGALALERVELFQALNQALQESQGLQEIAKVMLSTFNLSAFLNEWLKRTQKLLGFKKILCSLYDPRTSSFDRFGAVGISTKKFKAAQRIHPPLEKITTLLKEKYRVSNSYYIPLEQVDREIQTYELYRSPRPKLRKGNLWVNGDVLIHPVYAKDHELLALLSLDQPENNLIPGPGKIKLLEAFGDFLGLMMENNRLFGEVEKLSHTDEMTGLYNYRYLRDKVMSMIAENVSPIALLFIDLDGFKRYNDRYGHLQGDEVLKRFSGILLRAVGGHGFVTRYGGDEFIAVLPRYKTKKAVQITNQINRFINETNLNAPATIPVSFSYGLALYPDDGRDFGTLIDHADKFLYQRKQR
jgi:diguanylate cyclase (GGDEF)-like protein